MSLAVGDKVMVVPGLNDPVHRFPIGTIGEITEITGEGSYKVFRSDQNQLPYWQFIHRSCLQKINEEEESMGGMCQKFLIELMQVKQSILGPEVNYFTFEDAQRIANLSESKAKEIYSRIVNYEQGETFTFLGDHTCPFCILQDVVGREECDLCDYQEEHFKCDNPFSTFTKAKEIEKKMAREGKHYTTQYVVELAKERAGLKEEKAPTGLMHIDNMSEEDVVEQPYIYLTSNGSGTYYEICVEADHRVTVLGSVTVMNIDKKKAKLRLCDSKAVFSDTEINLT